MLNVRRRTDGQKTGIPEWLKHEVTGGAIPSVRGLADRNFQPVRDSLSQLARLGRLLTQLYRLVRFLMVMRLGSSTTTATPQTMPSKWPRFHTLP